MEMSLQGKTALVTGGGIGIGRAVARALAAAGADVAITYLSHDGKAVAEEIEGIGRRSGAFELDVTSSTDVDRTIDDVVTTFGGLDILVNNAGGLIGRVAIADMPDEHWHKVIDLNLTSTFSCIRSALRHLPDGGRIVNISSLAGQNGGGRGSVAYAAAKAGVHGLVRGLAKELGPRRITVNAVAPGLILDTPFHQTFTPAADQQATIAGTPLGRAGYPDDVAGAVLYLVSGQGAFCTGTVLDLNGGTYFS